MAFDALSLSLLTKELKQKIIGAKINKISQPEKDEIFLSVFNKTNLKIVLSANPSVNRFNLTEFVSENPKTAPAFCMLLRKHISNGIITELQQLPFERVVVLRIENKNELGYKQTKNLIFEVTGKSANIILTDDRYVILDSLKRFEADLNAEKLMMPGAVYKFFAKKRLFPDETEKIDAAAAAFEGDLFDFYTRNVAGLSPRTIRELCVLAGGHKEKASHALQTYLKNLGSPRPQIVYENGKPADAVPFDYSTFCGEKQYFSTLNEAHDKLFYFKDKAQRFAEKAKSISTLIKNAVSRTEKKLGIQRQALLEAKDGEKYRVFGDLILSNLHLIKKFDDKLVTQNFFEQACPEIEIPLNRAFTPQQNAQMYYKKYNKSKKSLLHNEALVKENTEFIKYLETLSYALSFSDENDLPDLTDELTRAGLLKNKKTEKTKIKHKESKSCPLKYSVCGFTVLAGKNNLQNEKVTFGIAKPKDLWFHTQAIHSSHVVIITENRPVPDEVLLKTAEITAFLSQAKDGSKIPVDFTERRNVKKPGGAKPGFVAYSDFRTFIVNPDGHKEFLTQNQTDI